MHSSGLQSHAHRCASTLATEQINLYKNTIHLRVGKIAGLMTYFPNTGENEFNIQNPPYSLPPTSDTVSCACHPSAEEVETAVSLKLTGQSA